MRAELFSDFSLVRINAPEIYKDPAFKDWFFNRPGVVSGDHTYPPPTLATWHRPGEPEFGEYSDIFMTVEFMGGDEGDIGGDGSESDMPDHIWEKLLRAVWEALGKPSYYIEAFVWLSNLDEGEMKPKEHMVSIRDELLKSGFSIVHYELLKNLLDRCEIWLDHLHLDPRDFALLTKLGMANVRTDLRDGKVCWVVQFYGPGHRIRSKGPTILIPPGGTLKRDGSVVDAEGKPWPPIPAPEDPNVKPTPADDETSVWDVDTEYPVADWQHEVAEDNTRQGYQAWVAHQRQIASENESAG